MVYKFCITPPCLANVYPYRMHGFICADVDLLCCGGCMIEIVIDGKYRIVEEGLTLLEAAKDFLLLDARHIYLVVLCQELHRPGE